MIQPQPAQRGGIGEGHGLQKLVSTLEALEKGQQAQQAWNLTIQSHLDALAPALAHLSRWCKRVELAIAVLGLAVLATLGVGLWQATHPPLGEYARALGAVDATLMQTWNTLPKATQEQLSATYQRLGWASPGQRSK